MYCHINWPMKCDCHLKLHLLYMYKHLYIYIQTPSIYLFTSIRAATRVLLLEVITCCIVPFLECYCIFIKVIGASDTLYVKDQNKYTWNEQIYRVYNSYPYYVCTCLELKKGFMMCHELYIEHWYLSRCSIADYYWIKLKF